MGVSKELQPCHLPQKLGETASDHAREIYISFALATLWDLEDRGILRTSVAVAPPQGLDPSRYAASRKLLHQT